MIFGVVVVLCGLNVSAIHGQGIMGGCQCNIYLMRLELQFAVPMVLSINATLATEQHLKVTRNVESL